MAEKNKRYTFDSYSLLAFLKNESGADKVEALLSEISNGKADGYVSVVNLAELFYIISREKSNDEAEAVIRSVKGWKISTVTADEGIAILAGKIKAKYPLAIADAFCIATAQEKDATVITGDSEFKSVTEVKIIWL